MENFQPTHIYNVKAYKLLLHKNPVTEEQALVCILCRKTHCFTNFQGHCKTTIFLHVILQRFRG